MGEDTSIGVTYGLALEKFDDRDNAHVFDVDLKSYTMTQYFSEKCPERFFNIGTTEANMVDIAAGFATRRAVSLVHTFAVSAAGRIHDQIRNGVAYSGLNVKIIGGHADLTAGGDGASRQYTENTSLTRTVPKMTVVVPCDSHETRLTAKAVLEHGRPCYLRAGRCALDCATDNSENYKFEIGEGVQLVDGTDIIIITCDLMVQELLKAEKILEAEGINVRVIDIHTIKLIDKNITAKAAKETEVIVTAEEHSMIGDLDGSAPKVIVGTEPIPIGFIGVEDKFSHSGAPKELLELFSLTLGHIAAAAKQTIRRKK